MTWERAWRRYATRSCGAGQRQRGPQPARGGLGQPRRGTPQNVAFDEAVLAAVRSRDDEAVINYQALPHADYAVPTPDHYLHAAHRAGRSRGEEAEVFNKVRNLGSMA